MKIHHYRYFGRWSAIFAAAALFSASGQACPPGMPGPASPLAGLWTGSISGDVTVNGQTNAPSPPNPNPQTLNSTSRIVSTLQIVFDGAGRPTTLPLVPSAFNTTISTQAVTAFNVGEMQTITNSTTQSGPSGATFVATEQQTTTITLAVTESILTAEHIRVVYATTHTQSIEITSTEPMSSSASLEQSSTGILTIDATAVGGLVMFSMDFNNTGSAVQVSGGNTVTSNGFVVGSLTGTLAAD